MSDVLAVLLAVVGLFGMLLGLKAATATRFCTLCGSVSLTWIAMLGLRWTGRSVDPTLVGVLIGESVTGLAALLMARAPAGLRVFRLPFFLTGTALAFAALGRTEGWPGTLGLLAALWLLGAIVAVWRRAPRVRRLAQALVACCRDW